MFKKYRKKPVVIRAMQWDGNIDYFIDSIKQMGAFIKIATTFSLTNNSELLIDTLEGVMTADIGDWIIIGVNGELYPCKDNIFKKTYEEVQNAND